MSWRVSSASPSLDLQSSEEACTGESGDGQRRLGDMLLAEVIFIAVEHPSRPLQQRVGCRKAAVQLTDMVDSQRIVARPRHTGVDPRPGAVAHKRHGIVQRRAGDPGIIAAVVNWAKGPARVGLA